MTKKLVILGGGISGLTLAWYLKKYHGDNIHLTLLEKSDRLGGWFRSIEKEGFIFDTGPHYIFTTEGQDIFDIISDLNLDKDMILSNLKSNVSRIYRKGKLLEIPRTFKDMLFSPLTKGLIPGIIHDWFTPRQTISDESIYDFMRRRFSKTLAEGFGESYVAGIISGDIKKLSMKAYLSRIMQLEKDYGSVVKGLLFKKQPRFINDKLGEIRKHAALNFHKGLSVLTNSLAAALMPHIIQTSAKKLLFERNSIRVGLEDGSILDADHVFSTVPSFSLAELLPEEQETTKQILNSFYYKSMAIVSLGYKEELLEKEGYGYVIPFSEHKPVIGVLWDSSVFPQMNSHKKETRLTIMIGEENLPKDFNEMSEDDFRVLALNEVKDRLNITQAPDMIHVSLVKKGIPKFFVGHEEKVNEVIQDLKRMSSKLTVIGSGFYGAAISRCITNAKKTASEFKPNLPPKP